MDVKHVANLANLPLTAEEEKIFGSQLEKVLEYVSQLQSIDTTGVKPTSQVTGIINRVRSDKITPGLELGDRQFKVKAIFEDE